MDKIILTGDRPTGRLHVGHYAGSLRRRVELQNSGEYKKTFIMIADAQALTDNIENPEKVRQNIIEVAARTTCPADWIDKATIFIQSQISELCELTFYYMDLVTVARLQRNPTVKSEIQMRNFEATSLWDFYLSHQPGFRYYRFQGNHRSVGGDPAAHDRTDQRSYTNSTPYMHRYW